MLQSYHIMHLSYKSEFSFQTKTSPMIFKDIKTSDEHVISGLFIFCIEIVQRKVSSNKVSSDEIVNYCLGSVLIIF